MKHYLDIRLLPDPEFPAPILMSALFSKLHRALVRLGSEDIGVSFPRAERTLGETLRLHGSQPRLTELMSLSWLQGLRDYTSVGDVMAIPSPVRYRVVRRVQAKSSAERLRRRAIKRHQLTEEQARLAIRDDVEQRLALPFVQIRSASTGEMFKLFIEQQAVRDEPADGAFSAYGLSPLATVPWF